MMPSKKPKTRIERRKPGLIITPPPARPIDDALFNPFREAKLAESTETISSPEIVSSLETTASLEIAIPVAPKTASLETVSSPETVSPPTNNLAAFAQTLAYGKGHLRLNHDYFDRVLTLLNENEQLLFIHILRYREKQHNYTVRLNWPLLEKRTHISDRTLSKTAKALEAKGLVERFDYQFGKGTQQGFRFRIFMPSSLAATSSPEITSRLEPASDSNRNKEVIEKNKREFASLDTKNCPDCHGTGFWYPEGVEKGVAKCLHEKLANQPSRTA